LFLVPFVLVVSGAFFYDRVATHLIDQQLPYPHEYTDENGKFCRYEITFRPRTWVHPLSLKTQEGAQYSLTTFNDPCKVDLERGWFFPDLGGADLRGTRDDRDALKDRLGEYFHFDEIEKQKDKAKDEVMKDFITPNFFIADDLDVKKAYIDAKKVRFEAGHTLEVMMNGMKSMLEGDVYEKEINTWVNEKSDEKKLYEQNSNSRLDLLKIDMNNAIKSAEDAVEKAVNLEKDKFIEIKVGSDEGINKQKVENNYKVITKLSKKAVKQILIRHVYLVMYKEAKKMNKETTKEKYKHKHRELIAYKNLQNPISTLRKIIQNLNRRKIKNTALEKEHRLRHKNVREQDFNDEKINQLNIVQIMKLNDLITDLTSRMLIFNGHNVIMDRSKCMTSEDRKTNDEGDNCARPLVWAMAMSRMVKDELVRLDNASKNTANNQVVSSDKDRLLFPNRLSLRPISWHAYGDINLNFKEVYSHIFEFNPILGLENNECFVWRDWVKDACGLKFRQDLSADDDKVECARIKEISYDSLGISGCPSSNLNFFVEVDNITGWAMETKNLFGSSNSDAVVKIAKGEGETVEANKQLTKGKVN